MPRVLVTRALIGDYTRKSQAHFQRLSWSCSRVDASQSVEWSISGSSKHCSKGAPTSDDSATVLKRNRDCVADLSAQEVCPYNLRHTLDDTLLLFSRTDQAEALSGDDEST